MLLLFGCDVFKIESVYICTCMLQVLCLTIIIAVVLSFLRIYDI